MTAFNDGTLLTAAALNAAFAQYYPAGNVSALATTLLNSTSASAMNAVLGLPTAAPGTNNGLATLDNSGHLPLAQLPTALQGAMSYQGVWNATTNTPTLTSGTGTKGYLYKCSVAGTTALDGITQWNVGDMAVFNGTVWDKWDGISSEVLSVAGRTGAVTIASTDLTDSTSAGRALLTAASVNAQRVAINLENLTGVANANATFGAGNVLLAWTSLTASRTGTLGAAASYNPGQIISLMDLSGNASPTITITAVPSGSDTIVGDTAITSAYGWLDLVSDGVSKFYGRQIASPTLFVTSASPAFTGTPTAPTAAVGTNSTQLATTAFVANAKLQKSFESAATAYTAGASLTFAHGLGTAPKLYYVAMQCVTADNNWAVGDEIIANAGTQGSGGSNYGVVVQADATNIYTRIGSNGVPGLNKTTFASVVLTTSSWKLVARAWV